MNQMDLQMYLCCSYFDLGQWFSGTKISYGVKSLTGVPSFASVIQLGWGSLSDSGQAISTERVARGCFYPWFEGDDFDGSIC